MIGGCRVLQSPVEGLSRLQETNSQWEGVPIGNGPRKNEYLKTSVRTGNDKFIFVGGSSMPWWNWDVIQRKSRKIIQRLVKNRQRRVFTTFEQGQPTKFVEQTSDRSCVTIIFFWQNWQHDVELVRVAGYLWPYGSHAAAVYSKWGRTKDR